MTIRVSPRARRLRLRVDPRTREVLLTVPKRTSARKALVWAAGHRQWLEATLAAMPERAAIAPGAILPLFGRPHRIEWDPGKTRRVETGDASIRLGGPEESLEPRLLRWLRAEARALLERETRELCAAAGLHVERVSVGDPRSRWGSCSSSGSIRYSWRLILAPEFVRRATVAHEVAHLVHMDHSPRFHALVERLLGSDPKLARTWLRREGAALHRIGAQG